MVHLESLKYTFNILLKSIYFGVKSYYSRNRRSLVLAFKKYYII